MFLAVNYAVRVQCAFSVVSSLLSTPQTIRGNEDCRGREGCKTHELAAWESAVSSLRGVQGGARRPPEGFPVFSAPRMASPNNVTVAILITSMHVWVNQTH